MPVLILQSPSRPSEWKSPNPTAPSTREPSGSVIVTSMDPPRLLSQERSLGALTSSCSSANSTRVRSAALRSSSFVASLGSTSTTVASPLPALIRTSPMARSMVAEIGFGVSKVGMAVSSSWVMSLIGERPDAPQRTQPV